MYEFLAKFIGALILSAVIFYGVQVFDYFIEYWAAALISFVIVYGGFLILDSDVISH